MKILAVDTSSRFGAVGLSEVGRPLGEIAFLSRQTYSVQLMPSIDTLLRICGISLSDVDLFGVATGPGSFTGLRVGLATMKGLAWAQSKPLVGISSLEVLARNLPSCPELIVPMLDAAKQRVYAAVYRWDPSRQLVTVTPPADIQPRELVSSLNAPTIFLGEGARRYSEEIRLAARTPIAFAPETSDFPRGIVVALLAHEAHLREEFLDIASAEPHYLRLSGAERKAGGEIHP